MTEPDPLVEGLADFLAREEPTPLAPDAAHALAEAALVAAQESREEGAPSDDESDLSAEERALVDAAAELLGASEPDPVDEVATRRLIKEAMAAEGMARPPVGASTSAEMAVLDRFRHLPLLAAAAVMLLVVSGALVMAPGTAPPSTHRFESGHRVVATGGAHWDWEAAPDGLRLRVHAGEVMFNVDPDAEESVSVVSGDVTVRVTGTVFTVGRSRGVTRVAVFEGSVTVTGPDLLTFMQAGDRWEGEPRRGLSHEGAAFEPDLSGEATRAVERRLDSAEVSPDFVPVLPDVPDLAADGRLPRRTQDDATDADSNGSGDGRDADPPAVADEPNAGAVADESPATVPPPTIEGARSALTNRLYPEARGLADRALRRGVTADWLMVRGDALRGEGRLAEAAAEYTRAASIGDTRDRAAAGLSAARILGRNLGRAETAREILLSSGALDPSSPVRSQAEALVLEMRGEP
ncbi:MAG: FecR domain-containing protein [Deltaproteobacteria bacterium]|nr:FecR domain-containing protein [Deltaproteobacteria bacterium]